MLDVDDLGTTRIPAIRVLQLSPENKVVFYHLNVCVLERTYEAQMFVDTETDFRSEFSNNLHLFRKKSYLRF